MPYSSKAMNSSEERTQGEAFQTPNGRACFAVWLSFLMNVLGGRAAVIVLRLLATFFQHRLLDMAWGIL